VKLDPYANGGDLRPQLEAFTREQIQELTYAAIAELSRRAFRGEEDRENTKKSRDVPKRTPFQ
jgi:hypothetical protein